nr:reverse transcriptase domain-containing protein [Tanacetum cinerariifolium]
MAHPDVAGRLQKWSIMLEEHNITYRPRTSVKGKILADFLIEMSGDVSQAAPAAFAASNNGAEYEALVAGLRIAMQMGVKNVQVNVDSKLVANQVLGTYVANEENMIKYLEIVKGLVLVEVLENKSIQEKEVATVIEEDGPTWMTHIVDYLKEGVLPGDKKDARKLRLKARQYELMEGVPYRRSKGEPKPGEGIKARLEEGNKNWVEELLYVLWANRTMIKSSHGDTPFSLTYGTEAVIPAEIGMPTYRTAAVDVVNNDEELHLNLDLLEERRERAIVCEARAKSKMMKYYNAKVRGVAFKPGDFVYRSNDASYTIAGGKLGLKWEGPYEVTKALGNGAYKLRSTDGTMLSKT